MSDRVDRFQRRHSVVGFPLAVVYKFFDDMGGYLVGLIAYYGFLSFFPLLFLLSTILGVVLAGHPDLQEAVIDSALSDFPVIGEQLTAPSTLTGSTTGIVLSSLVALYGGLGIGQAFQYAMNVMWGVPRNNRPNPFAARGRSILLLLIILLFVVLTTALSLLGNLDMGLLESSWRYVATGLSFVITVMVFALGMRRGTSHPVRLGGVLPGAVGAAVTWQVLQTYGVVFVDRVVRTSSTSNGVFALVLGLLAFLHLLALGIVLSAEANVVWQQRLWPRALLTPFTDNVDLTEADRKAYAGQAISMRAKRQQEIDVAFGERPDRVDPPG